MSEDCLYLNIWQPTKVKSGAPVMVWIHGGAFRSGHTASQVYDGSELARRGVVIVSTSYRLGILGFLAHPELSAESPQHVSGNYGLLDQIAALQWVRANIAGFGGDPSSVTLVGQSAGSTSVAILMVSPLSAGLFHRAIIESIGGSFSGPKQRLREPYYGMAPAEADGASRVPDIAAFRAMSADEVLTRLPSAPTIVPGTHYYPIIDGYVLPDEPDNLIGTTRRAKAIPILIGHNASEGLFWAGASPKTLGAYRDYIRGWLPLESVPSVLQRYPAATDSEAAAAAIDLTTDFRVAAPTALVARKFASVTEVHAYRLSRVSPFSRSNWGGAAHTAEIPYVFGNVGDPSRYDDADRTLSNAIAGAWARFAKTGDPNGPGLPKWPAYTARDYQVLDYGDLVSLTSDANDPAVGYFRDVYLRMRLAPAAH
jgi:para-nitrobenzyl esterase